MLRRSIGLHLIPTNILIPYIAEACIDQLYIYEFHLVNIENNVRIRFFSKVLV